MTPQLFLFSKNFVIYLMSVKLFLDRNKELLEKQTNNLALYIYQETSLSQVSKASILGRLTNLYRW